MKRTALMLILASFLVGCGKQEESVVVEPPKVEVIVTDVLGYKYRLLSESVVLGDGRSQAELWERIEPKVTDRWYTPALGTVRTNDGSMMFNSLLKTEALYEKLDKNE